MVPDGLVDDMVNHAVLNTANICHADALWGGQMNQSVIIEEAEFSDLKEISKLFDAYRVFYKQPSDLLLANQFLSERIDKHESVIFYAKNNKEEYLGFTQLYPSFSSVSAKRIWILNDLFVSEKARGLGIGKNLLNRAKEFALETDAKGIALETDITNVNAQGLYESLGYIKNSEHFYYFLEL